jgi:hypothetical protein
MRALLLACFVAAPAFARAAAGPEDIRKQLTPFTTLKGSFEQTKKIRVIKKPLKSEGRFVLSKDRGVLWENTKPLVSTVRVRRDDIAEIKDGKTVILVSTKDQPQLRVIGTVLFAVFAADVEELKRHFDFSSVAVSTSGWTAELRPKDAGVAQEVSRIELSGRGLLDSLTLFEADGDVTEIRFIGTTSAQPLDKSEAALFE